MSVIFGGDLAAVRISRVSVMVKCPRGESELYYAVTQMYFWPEVSE